MKAADMRESSRGVGEADVGGEGASACALESTFWGSCKPSFNYFRNYNQRGPLEYPFFRHFLRLVLSCSNADFCVQGRTFQHFSSSTFFLCTIPDFFDFSGPLHYFLQNSMQFLLIFLGDNRFCNFSSNVSQFFPEFRRISMISERVMSRFSYFREI